MVLAAAIPNCFFCKYMFKALVLEKMTFKICNFKIKRKSQIDISKLFASTETRASLASEICAKAATIQKICRSTDVTASQ